MNGWRVLLVVGVLLGGCAEAFPLAGRDGAPLDGRLDGSGTDRDVGPVDGARDLSDGAKREGGGPLPDIRPDLPPCGPAGCDDKLSCTDDACVGGRCVFTIKSGFCVINKVCVTNGSTRSPASCAVCKASISNTDWTDDASTCKDDGLGCTSAGCKAGVCSSVLGPGRCLINGKCRNSSELNPSSSCQECQPSSSTTGWTNRADKAPCTADAHACTDDWCKKGVCDHPLKVDRCLIGGTCHNNGDRAPSNPCRECRSGASTSAWSPRGDGDPCPNGTCAGGTCCTGCRSGSVCKSGTTKAACGGNGAPCQPCPTGDLCQNRTCVPQVTTYTLNVGSHGSVYSGTYSRGFWFTAPIGFTITGLRVPTAAGTDPQTVEILRLFSPPPTYPTTTSGFVSLLYRKGVAGSGFIAVNVRVNAGQHIGILGVRGTATVNTSYATATTHNTSILGRSVTLQRLLFQDNLFALSANNVSTSTLEFGRVEVQYTP